MLTLGLDTALQRCSVAILRGDEVLAKQCVDMERGHAEHLAPMAKLALGEAGISVADLDRVGVVVGPGGFTGVRVALAFARGLVIGTNVQAVGVTSLEALAGASQSPDEGLIAPVVDARRGQVYAALYGQKGEVVAAPFVATPEETLQRLGDKTGGQAVSLIGSGGPLLGPIPSNWMLSGASEQIDPVVVARLAARAPMPAGSPAPLYLRAPDAKPPKSEGSGAQPQ